MHAYTELLKPSVATHLQVLPVGGDGSPLLFIVRGGSLLQVFGDLESPSPKWLAEFALQGQVVAMCVLQQKYLILAFKPARLVSVEWIHNKLAIKTRSLHYYERLAPATGNFDVPYQREYRLSVDDSSGTIMFWFQQGVASFLHPPTTDPLEEIGFSIRPDDKKDIEKTSMLFSTTELAEILGFAYVIDMCYLPAYKESTIAVLAAERPSWVGLAPVNGFNTHTLVLLTPNQLKRQADPSTSVVSRMQELSSQFTRIVPLHHPSRSLALLIGSDKLVLLSIDLELVEICHQYHLDDCVVQQLGNTTNVLIVLNSGAMLLLNTETVFLCEQKNGLLLPAAITSYDGLVAVSSYCAGVKIFKSSTQMAKISTIDFDESRVNSLEDIYSEIPLVSDNKLLSPVVDLTESGEIPGYGALSAVTTIDNGLACATHNGVLIVERELPFDETDLVECISPLLPGKFWLVNHPSRLLVAVHNEHRQTNDPEKKRRKTSFDGTIDKGTMFIDLSSNSGSVAQLPRGLSRDQYTILVHEENDCVWIIQARKILKFKPKRWQLESTVQLAGNAISAEVGAGLIMVRFDIRLELYDSKTLKLVHTVESMISTLSETLLISLNHEGLVEVYDLVNNDYASTTKYQLEGLKYFIVPYKKQAAMKNDIKPNDIISLYSLCFDKNDYIGVHMDRLFAVYEITGDKNLIKRFTIPFAVNQSPIWLKRNQLLVFPGSKTHVLVKGRQNAFVCHQLQLYGDKLLDIIEYGKNFVWLDTKDSLHFARWDSCIDHLSSSLPIRHIALPNRAAITKHISYHDEFAAVIVGTNEKISPSEDQDVSQNESDDNKKEEVDGDGADTKKSSSLAYHKCRVYVLPLTTYSFQKAVFEQDETLLSLKLISKLDGEQILALGTSKDSVETQETNGYIRLYNIKEAEGTDSGDSADPVQDERDIIFHEFDSEPLRGPVSAITEIMGFVAVSHGQQIRVYDFSKGLEPIGFYDTQVYMQDLKSIRNILVLGERLRTPRLVNMALQPRRLDLLSSADPLTSGAGFSPTIAVEAVSSASRGDLAVVCATRDDRLQLFLYDPENPESVGGPRLIPQISFHTGRRCVSLVQAQLYASDDIACYGVATDGSLFSVRPLNEDVFRTIFLLTQQMVEKEPSWAGLNPRMHRAYFAPHSCGTGGGSSGSGGASGISEGPSSHQLIDINYAQQFWSLPTTKQALYTRNLGYEGLKRVQKALNSEGRDALKL